MLDKTLGYILCCQSPALFLAALALLVAYLAGRKHRVKAFFRLLLCILCAAGAVALYFLGIYKEYFTIRDFFVIRAAGWIGLAIAAFFVLLALVRAFFAAADARRAQKEAAENDGLLYAEKDLFHFHISMKSSRLVILAGKSGIGKSGLVRLYGRALGLPESQVRFLPVRPSWMDDGDVLGYVDMKNMVYRSADTGLAELLIDAAAHPEKQYIVCFDEMNLARVEHYFAQFISVLEKEDHPMIRLYNPSLAPRLYNSEKYPPEIPVGRNVLFTGTVNVDESTCHFSDKILDRANVITLSQCHFRDLLKLSPKERKVYKEITAEEYDDFRVKEGMGLNDKELELLDALNDAFTKSGMPYGIGFRVAQQMGRYLENIPEEAGISRGEGLDAQLVQRVFTKLRGSADQLSALLSLSDKNTAEGLLPAILVRFKALSDFQGSQAVLKRKAGELKLYDYTM